MDKEDSNLEEASDTNEEIKEKDAHTGVKPNEEKDKKAADDLAEVKEENAADPTDAVEDGYDVEQGEDQHGSAEDGKKLKKEDGDVKEEEGDCKDEEEMSYREYKRRKVNRDAFVTKKEIEKDAEPDDRARVSEPVALNELDATLDVILGGSGMVTSLSQNGFQYLLSGVRANTGAKAGRYFFEVKVLEKLFDKAEELEFVFQPGHLGIKADLLTGLVTSVAKQAYKYGVRPGMRFLTIGGKPFTESLFFNAMEGTKNYSVTFAQGVESTLRVGVSLAKSSNFLGDSSASSACFDAINGCYYANGEKQKVCEEFMCNKFDNQVVGILLNLDDSSPNANTLSIFLDGIRAADPQPLPKDLHGKALFPAVTFKNVSLLVNLGGSGALRGLGFRCPSFADLVKEDAEVSPLVKADQLTDGKFSVVVPVALPEEGYFEYVDRFLERHPEYFEISERQFYNWCLKSGVTELGKYKQKYGGRYRGGAKVLDSIADGGKRSLNNPYLNFGLPSLDAKEARPVLKTIMEMTRRNYIVVDARANWIVEEREKSLKRFFGPNYNVIAKVAVGEPSDDHKEWVHSQMLAEHAKETEKKIEERQRAEDDEKTRNQIKAEKFEGKGRKSGAKKAVLCRFYGKQGSKKCDKGDRCPFAHGDAELRKAASDSTGSPVKEEVKEEKEEDKTSEAGESPAKKMKLEDDAEKVSPSKNVSPSKSGVLEAWVMPKPPHTGSDVWHLPPNPKVAELPLQHLMNSYQKFVLPTKDEGFDAIEYEWLPEKDALDYIQDWTHRKKITSFIEGLLPGQWFKKKRLELSRVKLAMLAKQRTAQKQDYKKIILAKGFSEVEAAKAARQAADAAAKDRILDRLKEKSENGETEKDGEDSEGTAVEKDVEAGEGTPVASASSESLTAVKSDKTEAAKAHEEAGRSAAEEADEAVNAIGEDGRPLYVSFQNEDWALLQAKYELHLLCHAFMEDVEDEAFIGIPEDHVEQYYYKYFKKHNHQGWVLPQQYFRPRKLGQESWADTYELLRDCLNIEEKAEFKFVVPVHEKEAEFLSFLHLVEEERVDRARRIEAGDETAQLNIPKEYDELEEGKRTNKTRFGEGQAKAKRGVAQMGMCHRFLRGVCTHGDTCRYSHGDAAGQTDKDDIVLLADSSERNRPADSLPRERRKPWVKQRQWQKDKPISAWKPWKLGKTAKAVHSRAAPQGTTSTRANSSGPAAESSRPASSRLGSAPDGRSKKPAAVSTFMSRTLERRPLQSAQGSAQRRAGEIARPMPKRSAKDTVGTSRGAVSARGPASQESAPVRPWDRAGRARKDTANGPTVRTFPSRKQDMATRGVKRPKSTYPVMPQAERGAMRSISRASAEGVKRSKSTASAASAMAPASMAPPPVPVKADAPVTVTTPVGIPRRQRAPATGQRVQDLLRSSDPRAKAARTDGVINYGSKPGGSVAAPHVPPSRRGGFKGGDSRSTSSRATPAQSASSREAGKSNPRGSHNDDRHRGQDRHSSRGGEGGKGGKGDKDRGGGRSHDARATGSRSNGDSGKGRGRDRDEPRRSEPSRDRGYGSGGGRDRDTGSGGGRDRNNGSGGGRDTRRDGRR